MASRSSNAPGPSSGLAGFTSKLASYLPSSRPARSAYDGPIGATSSDSEDDDHQDATTTAAAAGSGSSDWDWRTAQRSRASNFDDSDAISLLSDIADRNGSRRGRRRRTMKGWRKSVENLKLHRACLGPADMVGACLGSKRRTRRAGSSDEESDEGEGPSTSGWRTGWIANCLGARYKETDPQRRARAWRGEQSRLGEDEALLDDASDAGSDVGSRGRMRSGRGWGDEADALESEDYHETIRRLSTTSGGESSQGALSGDEDARSVGDVDVSAIPAGLLIDTETEGQDQARVAKPAAEEEFGELQSGTVRLPDQDKRELKMGESPEPSESAAATPGQTASPDAGREGTLATAASEDVKAELKEKVLEAPTHVTSAPGDESQVGEDTLTAANARSDTEADTTAMEEAESSTMAEAALASAPARVEAAGQIDPLAVLSSEQLSKGPQSVDESPKPKASPLGSRQPLASEDEDGEDDDDHLSIATTQLTDSGLPPTLSPAALEGLSAGEAAALKAQRRAERREAREKLLRLRIEAEMRAKGRFGTEAEAEAAAGGFGLEEQGEEGEDWARKDAELEESIRERMREEEEERKARKRQRKAERREAREAEWQRYQEEHGLEGEDDADYQPQQEVVVHHHYYNEPAEPHGDDYDDNDEQHGRDQYADDSRQGLYTTLSPEAFQFPANPVKPAVDDEAGQDEEMQEDDEEDEEEADMAGLGLARSKRRPYGAAGGGSSQGSGSRPGYTARSGADGGSRSNASGSNAGTRRERPGSAQALNDGRLAPPDHDDVAALLGGGAGGRSRGIVGEGSAGSGSGSRQGPNGGGGGGSYREKSGRPARGHRREASRSTNSSSKGREGLGVSVSPTPASGAIDRGAWSPVAVPVVEEESASQRSTRERSEADADAAAGGFGDFVLPGPTDEEASQQTQSRHLDIPGIASPTSPQQGFGSSSSYRDRERKRMGAAPPSVSSGGSNSQNGRTRRREGPSARRAA